MIAAAPMLRGFSHVHRFFDPVLKSWTAQVLPGEFYVSNNDEIISTVLGSCVSVCMCDPVLQLGGMNHFLLPGEQAGHDGQSMRYGAVAVERLINELVKYGGQRERFECKLFGGGRVIGGKMDVGLTNIEFVRRYLKDEELKVVAESLGGAFARRVRYHPRTGKAQQLLMRMEVAERVDAEAAVKVVDQVKRAGAVELF